MAPPPKKALSSDKGKHLPWKAKGTAAYGRTAADPTRAASFDEQMDRYEAVASSPLAAPPLPSSLDLEVEHMAAVGKAMGSILAPGEVTMGGLDALNDFVYNGFDGVVDGGFQQAGRAIIATPGYYLTAVVGGAADTYKSVFGPIAEDLAATDELADFLLMGETPLPSQIRGR